MKQIYIHYLLFFLFLFPITTNSNMNHLPAEKESSTLIIMKEFPNLEKYKHLNFKEKGKEIYKELKLNFEKSEKYLSSFFSSFSNTKIESFWY